MKHPELGHKPESKRSFLQTLERKNFKIIGDINEAGIRKTTIEVPEGRHHIVAGFPEFDVNDKNFFYGNNSIETQHQPLKLDFDSVTVQPLIARLKSSLKKGQNLEETMGNLDEIVQKTIRSDARDERITRVSEIVEKGHSACAGKVLVAAGLLKAVRPEINTQMIYGASSLFKDRRPHDIGHVWLRAAEGNTVVLYDPYFQHMVPYDSTNPRSFTGDPFAEYSVGAYFAANVIQQLPVKTLDRRFVKLVESPNGNKSVWVANQQALGSQITSEMDFEFVTNKSGKLTFINEGLYSARNDGAGFGYPVKEITKVE